MDTEDDLITAFVVFMLALMLYIYMPDLSQAVWIP